MKADQGIAAHCMLIVSPLHNNTYIFLLKSLVNVQTRIIDEKDVVRSNHQSAICVLITHAYIVNDRPTPLMVRDN